MYESTQRPKIQLKPKPASRKETKEIFESPSFTGDHYRKAWDKIIKTKCTEVREIIVNIIPGYELDAFVKQVIEEVEHSKNN